MKDILTALWVIFLFSLPLWMGNQYMLHILVVTGIFIIAAMSLNLLLGYAGQLSLGHVAFFGIGAYASALVARVQRARRAGYGARHGPETGMVRNPRRHPGFGACGWFIGGSPSKCAAPISSSSQSASPR